MGSNATSVRLNTFVCASPIAVEVIAIGGGEAEEEEESRGEVEASIVMDFIIGSGRGEGREDSSSFPFTEVSYTKKFIYNIQQRKKYTRKNSLLLRQKRQFFLAEDEQFPIH